MKLSMPPDGFEDGPPDGFADESVQKDSLLNRTAEAITGAENWVGEKIAPLAKSIEPYMKSQAGSPQQLLQSVPPLFSKTAGKVGEYATNEISKGPNAVDPYTAAAVGTGISMGPDIAMSGINPMAEEAAVSKAVPDAAKPFGRRFLGMQKSMLKTPFARGQADKAAGVALENNVIPWGGNPEIGLERASDLANKSGERIGGILKQVPSDASQAMDNLESIRGELTKGFSGGVFQKANSLIDDVKFNLSELFERTKSKYEGMKPLLGKETSANAINQIKTRLGRSINYLADLAAQSDNKSVVNNLANSIRDSVRAALPEAEYQAFIKDQKLFNMSELMKKGLNNEVAAQQGNRMFNPYSTIAATGELATGQPIKAAATLGLTETAMRRGAGTTARGLTEASRALPAVPEIASKVATVAPHGNMIRQDGKVYKWNGSQYVEQ